jgi:allantoicase
MTGMDRLMIYGNATDPNGNTVNWNLQGLAAMYNDAVIISLNGGTFSEMNTSGSPRIGFGGVTLTCIATMSTTS